MLKPSPGRFFLLFLSEAGAQAARSGLWIKFIRVLKVPIKHEWNVMCACVICCILSFVAIAIIVVIGTVIRTVMIAVVILVVEF